MTEIISKLLNIMPGHGFFSHVLFGVVLFGIALFVLMVALGVIFLDCDGKFDVMYNKNKWPSKYVADPRLFGMIPVLTFFVGIIAIYFFGDETPIKSRYFLGFLASLIFLISSFFVFDTRKITLLHKLGVQCFVTIVLIAFGVVIDNVYWPWEGPCKLGWLTYPVTLLWVMGVTNTFKVMDGINGLTAGVTVIASLFFGTITLLHGSSFVYINCYSILAGGLGMLVLSFPSRKMILGDLGSVFIGFVFATLAVIALRYDHSHTSFLVMPLLLFNFIFDAVFTFIRRLLKGEKVTLSHEDHLYQLLGKLGFRQRVICIFHYCVAFSQGIGAMYMVSFKGDNRVYVFIPFLVFQMIYSCLVLIYYKRKVHG